METITLADILTPNVITVAPEISIAEALQTMRSNNISCIIAIDENRPVGIVTERNVVRYIARQSAPSADHPIRSIMSSPVITATASMPIFEAYNILSTHGMRHLAVVNDATQLIGVVTLSNIVEHLSYDSFVETKRVAQVMTNVVFTVSRGTDVRQALVRMDEKAMSCIVVTEDDRPVGIITERDVSRLHMEHPDLSRIAVGDVMTTSLQTVTGDTQLPVAIEIMKRKKLRRLVVIDKEGRIKGLATQSDIVKGLEGKYIQALNDIIKEKDHLLQHTYKDLAVKTAYLDNILHSSIDYGIIASDIHNTVIYFNPGAEKILGAKADQVLGHNILTLHGHDNALLGRLNEVLNTIGNGERTSFLIKREQDGVKQILNARASGIIDKQDRLVGYFLMINDITDRKLAEESLKKAHDDLEHRVEERTRELAKAMTGSIEAIALTVEMRDPYTSGHQRRVADLAAAIARRLALPSDQIEGVYMAGLLHDIGKIKVPTGILSYPGRLTDTEFAIIKPHPEIGYNILKGIDFPWPLATIVLQHHERLNGSGYPHGLKGDAILQNAKILAVADVVEAMSSHRPYRPALGIDRALTEITAKKGTHYDPDAVEACVALFMEDNYRFPPHSHEITEEDPGNAQTART
ncbi:MAG: CBS domain-containing protein [Desulfobulbaceae bacterium]|nr:CBS domain-containing protein [Desulfobulbaceae bacterium]